jgi:hypothetical protein
VASTRPKIVEEASTAFSDWHRSQLPKSARMMDVDLCYYEDSAVYAVGEVIHIRRGTLEDADTDAYEIWTHKKRILENLSARLGVPCIVVWATEDDDEVVVKNLRTQKVRRVDADGYATLLRLFRDRRGGGG